MLSCPFLHRLYRFIHQPPSPSALYATSYHAISGFKIAFNTHTHAHPHPMCSPLCSPEPHAGFKIAFNMFDADGNQMVDKREFMVVSRKY